MSSGYGMNGGMLLINYTESRQHGQTLGSGMQLDLHVLSRNRGDLRPVRSL